MKETIRKLNERRSASETEESGFTLIELLIVIVVLGILAAIVVFALSGVTGQSTTAACQSDAKTVGIGVAALQAENPTSYSAYTSAQWQTNLIGNTLTGAPFLQSWPTGNSAYYTISVAPATSFNTTGDAVAVATTNGDVIVTPVTGPHAGKTFDATVNPVTACQKLAS
ncbi:MAG TPA: prepilin-type N-terminal cleavage/methylation domain-containing protein [Acidimicrobiales bacterium]|jgi:general secretion pathway protein G|nr:prepilin-type N-terminal cleavage/methylation domain-containing protein [Acidimicrobiales bacterium]